MQPVPTGASADIGLPSAVSIESVYPSRTSAAAMTSAAVYVVLFVLIGTPVNSSLPPEGFGATATEKAASGFAVMAGTSGVGEAVTLGEGLAEGGAVGSVVQDGLGLYVGTYVGIKGGRVAGTVGIGVGLGVRLALGDGSAEG